MQRIQVLVRASAAKGCCVKDYILEFAINPFGAAAFIYVDYSR